MAQNYSAKTQTGCLMLFGAPFVFGGVVALGKAARMALIPSVDWAGALGLGAIGLTFALIGLALPWASYRGSRIQVEHNKRRQLYPQSLWMWREDWSHGRVQSSSRTSMIAAWVFAILWNVLSFPALYMVPKTWATNRMALVALVFPLAGVFLLMRAVRQTIRWEEFGKTWFDIVTLPGVIGKEMRGTINVHFPWPPEGGVLVKLSCVNRVVTGSGKGQNTSEKILWRDEQTIPSGQMQSGPIGSAIPVAFRIPWDAVATNTEDSRDSIVWCLEADARTPGVNYNDLFEVPVFRTADTPAVATAEDMATPFSSTTEVIPAEKPRDSRIVVRPSESGGTEYDFSAARNIGVAFSPTVFFLIWTGAIWLMLDKGAPFIFPLVFGLFDVFLFIMILKLWLGTSKVVIGSGNVAVHTGILGFGPTRTVQFSQIVAFTMPVGMQSGGRSGRPYYDIKLRLNDGKEVKLASGIGNKLEAEWLIARMRTETGFKS